MGATNNASSQNTNAQQQIQQAQQQAIAAFQQWLQSNPFPLANAKPPAPAPQGGQQMLGGQQLGGHRFGGQQQGGGTFGGPTGGAVHPLLAALMGPGGPR